MDPFTFTTRAHRDHDFLGPLAPERADGWIESLGLAPDGRALDVGCGKGEFLLRVVARWRVAGLGVDVNPSFVAEARRRARTRGLESRVEIREAPAASLDLPRESLALAICLGATQAFGGYVPALRALRPLLAPGGNALLGEGFWRRQPDPEYLAALGATADEATDHAGNVATAEREGFEVLDAGVSSDAEWDDYEDRYALAVESHARERPDDPDTKALLERIRKWRAAYLAWGRTTLGFGIYRLRRSGPAQQGVDDDLQGVASR